MPDLLIRPATIADVYAVAANLRPADAAEALAVGKDPRRALRASFRTSLTPAKVLLIDGRHAALWGLGGDILSDVGIPWLLTTPAIERVPMYFTHQAALERDAMLAIKPRLENFVAADYLAAVRFAALLGFAVDPPFPVGPGRVLFRRFWTERRSS